MVDKLFLIIVKAIHLIPTPLYEGSLDHIPAYTRTTAIHIKHYFVENVRTARRVLKSYDRDVVIDDISFVLIDADDALMILDKWCQADVPIGIMSEAGMPAIADPGNVIVAAAHRLGIAIVPHSGPNSILLSLIASGFNGQHFTFLGYLPIDIKQKVAAIRRAEEQVIRHGITQIFIETPYRNNQMLDTLCSNLHKDSLLCIAANITSAQSYIRTKPISAWILDKPDLHKQPVIFLIGRR